MNRFKASTTRGPTDFSRSALDPNDPNIFTSHERVHTGKLVHSTTPGACAEIKRTRLVQGFVPKDQSYDSLTYQARELEFAFFMVSPDRAMFPFSSHPKVLPTGSPIKLICISAQMLLRDDLTMFYVGSTPTQFGGNSYRSCYRSHVTFVRDEDVALAESLWERLDKRGNRILFFDSQNDGILSKKVCVNGSVHPHTVAVSFLGGLRLPEVSDIDVYDGTKLSFSGEVVRCPSPDCSFHCGSFAALKDHFLVAGHVDGDLHACSECNKTFDVKSTLEHHFAAVHLNKKEHQCVECGKSFSQKGNLELHVQSVHLNATSHKCDECNRGFSQRSKLQMHVASVHRSEKPHVCAECGAAFALKPYLQSHIALVHNRDRAHPHPCLQCEKSFAQKCDLARHVASVHCIMERHQCGECDKSFLLKGHLDLHVASVHRGRKPHKCTSSDCQASFAQVSDLRRHMIAVHLRLRPHQCDQCDKSFSEGSDLKRHVFALH